MDIYFENLGIELSKKRKSVWMGLHFILFCKNGNMYVSNEDIRLSGMLYIFVKKPVYTFSLLSLPVFFFVPHS